jgi:hypothetical protein
MPTDDKALDDLLARLFQVHPWHGVTPCADAPATAHPTRASRSCAGCLLRKLKVRFLLSSIVLYS